MGVRLGLDGVGLLVEIVTVSGTLIDVAGVVVEARVWVGASRRRAHGRRGAA